MENKIAILRGINVGGNRKILMVDLKQLFQQLGCTDVKTYIQSGNVIFKAPNQKSNAALAATLETAIKDTFGFDVPVIVRTAESLAKSIEKNPFYEPIVDINTLHLTFLSEVPSPALVAQLASITSPPDRFVIDQADVFIQCAGKYHESKLTNNFFEKKLNVSATTRNWKTVLKLLELGR